MLGDIFFVFDEWIHMILYNKANLIKNNIIIKVI